MKKAILMLCIACGLAVSSTYAEDQPAQDKKKTETDDSKTKVKPNTTMKDKAHNVVHPKNKKSHGTKMKHKTEEGKTKTETSPAKQ